MIQSVGANLISVIRIYSPNTFVYSINFYFPTCAIIISCRFTRYIKFLHRKIYNEPKTNCSSNNKNEMKNTQERNNITISSRRSAQLDLTATLLLLISTVSICVLPILRWIYQFHSIAHAHTLRPTRASGTSTQTRALFVRSSIQWNERIRVVNTEYSDRHAASLMMKLSVFTGRVNSKRKRHSYESAGRHWSRIRIHCVDVYWWRSRRWWMYALQLWSCVVSGYTMLRFWSETRGILIHTMSSGRKRQTKEHSGVATELLCLSFMYHILWSVSLPIQIRDWRFFQLIFDEFKWISARVWEILEWIGGNDSIGN